MKVLIFEPSGSGHRYSYVKMIMPELIELGCEVLLATGRDYANSFEWREQMEPLSRQMEVIWLDRYGKDDMPPVKLAMVNCGCLREVAEQTRPDHIFVMCGDGIGPLAIVYRMMHGRLWPKGTQAETILFRGGFGYCEKGLKNRLASWAKRHLLKLGRWDWVHFIDPQVYEWTTAHDRGLAQRSGILPDPVETPAYPDKHEARRSLSLPPNGRYIGCLGGLNRRKGIDLLIEAFVAVPLDAGDRLLLIGKAEPCVKAMLELPSCKKLIDSGQIVWVDGYVSEAQFHQYLAALDIVCTPYPRYKGSSGILLHAVSAGKPLLAPEFGWLGRAVRDFALGWTCDVLSKPAFTAAIRRSLDNVDSFQSSGAAKLLLEFFSPRNFVATLTRRVRARKCGGGQADLAKWDDVKNAAGCTAACVQIGPNTRNP